MKIAVCYPSGQTPLACSCMVHGLCPSQEADGRSWVSYAVYEINGDPKIAPALVDALSKFGVEYSDETFASEVPESANVTAGLVEMVLARDDFHSVCYRSITRQWNADYCTETVRRTVPASAIRFP